MRALLYTTVAAAWAVWAATWAPAAALDEEMAELAAMLRESCAAETGVELALLARVNAGEDLMPDAALKCYTKCVMETAGMLADGVVDVDLVLSLMDPEMRARSEAALRSCGTQPGADHCDIAFQTQRCWQTANRKDYFLI